MMVPLCPSDLEYPPGSSLEIGFAVFTLRGVATMMTSMSFIEDPVFFCDSHIMLKITDSESSLFATTCIYFQ